MSVNELHPCPKPARRPKARKPLTARKPMRRVGKKGAAFPKVKQRAFRTWLRTEKSCELWDCYTTERISPDDKAVGHGWRHRCWYPIDPAHVGLKQSQGAGDVGQCIPLCRASHRFLDRNGYAAFEAVTGVSQAELERRAGGYGLAWVERGGVAPSHTQEPT